MGVVYVPGAVQEKLEPMETTSSMATGGSCEQNRTKAYSEDLRWRMIYNVCLCIR